MVRCRVFSKAHPVQGHVSNTNLDHAFDRPCHRTLRPLLGCCSLGRRRDQFTETAFGVRNIGPRQCSRKVSGRSGRSPVPPDRPACSCALSRDPRQGTNMVTDPVKNIVTSPAHLWDHSLGQGSLPPSGGARDHDRAVAHVDGSDPRLRRGGRLAVPGLSLTADWVSIPCAAL